MRPGERCEILKLILSAHLFLCIINWIYVLALTAESAKMRARGKSFKRDLNAKEESCFWSCILAASEVD